MNISSMLWYDFFIFAVLSWVFLSLAFAIIWNLVVMRGEANISHTISHFSLAWIAVALLFQLPFYATMIAAALVWALAVSALKNTKKFWNDSINEIMAQWWLVIAIIILWFVVWYKASIVNYLFWDILTVSSIDLYLSLGLAIWVLVFFWFYYNQLFQMSFHKELALSKWTKVTFVNTLYTIILSISIALSIKVIWVLLVTAFMIIPPNIAKLVAKNYNSSFVWSIVFGSLSVILWLYLSFVFNIPSGAAIVGVMILIFLITTLLTNKLK